MVPLSGIERSRVYGSAKLLREILIHEGAYERVGWSSDALAYAQFFNGLPAVFAAEQAATAMLDVETKAVAVRENMARLRQLRLAKEAQEIRTNPAAFEKKKPKRRVRLIRVPA